MDGLWNWKKRQTKHSFVWWPFLAKPFFFLFSPSPPPPLTLHSIQGVMVRLMLVLAPVMCILSGIAVSHILSIYMRNLDTKARKKKLDNSYPVKNEVAGFVILMMTFFLVTYTFHCTWVSWSSRKVYTVHCMFYPCVVLTWKNGHASSGLSLNSEILLSSHCMYMYLPKPATDCYFYVIMFSWLSAGDVWGLLLPLHCSCC